MMAFTHQYTHAGTTAASLAGSQVMLSSKAAHSPTSPTSIDQNRALMHESGLPLLHFLPRMSGLSEVYGQGSLTHNGLGVEPSAFYPMTAPPGHLPTSPEQWKGLAGQAPMVYPFDPMLAVHPYASFYGGLDLNNAARRKNATRETTSALKAWLYEHRKNPYPTKGEKIMLAIITKMTLTQVSTWFANARRRLKKESKSGWNDKERDLDDSDFETDVDDRSDEKQDKHSLSSISCSRIEESDDDDIDIKVTSDLSDISDAENENNEETTISTGSRLSTTSESSAISSNCNNNRMTNNAISPGRTENVTTIPNQRNSVVVPANARPKIWSIDEIMNKDTRKASANTGSQQSSSFAINSNCVSSAQQTEHSDCSSDRTENTSQTSAVKMVKSNNHTIVKPSSETVITQTEKKDATSSTIKNQNV